MRIIVIGGTGHVGTYMVPRLIESGHEVLCVSRGNREPYQSHGAWSQVERIQINRGEEESGGVFGQDILKLKPDVVVDMICYTLESARQLVDALRGKIQHYLSCGTIWVHGPSALVPTTENQPRSAFGKGIPKAVIEEYLLDQARRHGFPATVIHPGQIVGPGWPPPNPAGHFSPEVFARLSRGEELALPHFGLETIHPVHADDVAQVFEKAIGNWNAAIGESFHAVSSAALTLRGYAEAVASWFGRKAQLKFLPWEKWKATVSEEEAAQTLDHISHSPNCSMAKARRFLGYEPRYTSLQAVYEAVTWLIENGTISV